MFIVLEPIGSQDFLLHSVSFQPVSHYDSEMTRLKIKCPRCGVKTDWEGNESRPFCSDKCRMVDLGNWANEEYAIDGGKAPQHDRDDALEF